MKQPLFQDIHVPFSLYTQIDVVKPSLYFGNCTKFFKVICIGVVQIQVVPSAKYQYDIHRFVPEGVD